MDAALSEKEKRHLKALYRIANGGWLPTDALWATDHRGVASSSRATVWKTGDYAIDGKDGRIASGKVPK
jgi:hypothetical protein